MSLKVDDFFGYQEETLRQGVFLTFCGPLTHDFMVRLGEMLKSNMSMQNVDKNVILKVFSLVIEQTQNIIFYSAEKPSAAAEGNEEMGVGTLTVGFEDGHFFILCGNRIANDNVDKLRGKLLPIQKMNKDELKQYYKEHRRMETDVESKGAGLGFIEMARKASQPIEFAFRKLDENHSFFTLKTII